METDFHIGYPLSRWARRYVASLEESATFRCVRERSRTCSRAELQALLQHYQLPMSEAVWDFELNVGGWGTLGQRSELGFGVYLSLLDGPGQSAVAESFRRRAWLFEEDEEDPDEGPLRGEGYPRAFCGESPLVPAGMITEDEVYFIAPNGEILLYIPMTGSCTLVSGCARTFFEQRGLELARADFEAEIHVCADVEGSLLKELNLTRCDEACDQWFKVWTGSEMQVRQIGRFGPSIPGTHVAARSNEILVEAVRVIARHLRVERLLVQPGANLISDFGGRRALTNAGVVVEEQRLRGDLGASTVE